MALPPIPPEKRQKLLLGVLLIAAAAFAGYRFLLEPRAAEVAELETRLEAVRLQNQAARALARGNGTGDVEQQLAHFRQQLKTVEGLIPSTEELPDLLDAISAEAQRTGVQLTLIQPVEATEEQFYTRRVYDVGVVGSYHAIAQFLTRVASLPRIVTPTNLVLTRQGQAAVDSTSTAAPRLEARFSIETYVIPQPENPDVDAS